MASDTILLVDDEPGIIELARLYLVREGYVIQSTGDGLLALELIEKNKPALVILDVMLPGLDGFEVCRQLRARQNEVLILMVTARDEDIDRILGLELGADDYLTKPFNPRELVARVKALLRRGQRQQNPATGLIRVGDLLIDPDRREVHLDGKLIDFRVQEFELLSTLAQHPGRVYSREQLLNLAWGYEFAGQTRTVDVHIAQIRKKIAHSQVEIVTVTGIGYKLAV